MSAHDNDLLHELVAQLRETFMDHLVAVVLFGSAAADARRAVSDTNVALILTSIDPARLEAARQAITLIRVALRLRLLVLTRDELPATTRSLTVKIADILRRRKVLFGPDVFAGLEIPRDAAIDQVRQSLLHLTLRLRESWLDGWDASRTCAEVAGGLRACAAQVLALEGTPATSAREALTQVAGDPLPALSAAREARLNGTEAEELRLRLLHVCAAMTQRAGRLG